MGRGGSAQALAQLLQQGHPHTLTDLEGGIPAWQQAGLPVRRLKNAPLPLMRQVQIGAGSLVLLGVLLGTFVAPGFYGLAAFVGAGLVVAGVTGFCGMANILAVMPWNKRAA